MRGLLALILSGLLATCLGCASMCDASFDCDYHAFGGMRDRHDRSNGRVASVFHPAAAQPAVIPPREPLPPYEDPRSLIDDDDEDETSGTDDEGEGSSDEGDLEKRLLDELEGLEDLPDIKPDEEPAEI